MHDSPFCQTALVKHQRFGLRTAVSRTSLAARATQNLGKGADVTQSRETTRRGDLEQGRTNIINRLLSCQISTNYSPMALS